MRSTRARPISPFLREAFRLAADIAEAFLEQRERRGRRARAGARRRSRSKSGSAGSGMALALAVALGDLAGDLQLEEVTAAAVRLRRPRDRPSRLRRHRGARARRRAARLRGHRAWASSAATSSIIPPTSICSLLFDPATLPRRARDDAGEAAVRIGRRIIEILQQRTADGYVAAGRPAASPVARSDADRAAGRCRDLALRILGFAVGTRGLHPGPRSGRRHRAWPAVPRRDPAIHLAPLARLRRDRGSPADFGADPRPFCPKRPDWSGLRPQAWPRRNSRGRVFRPDPADDPRRPRCSAARPGDTRCHRRLEGRRAPGRGDRVRAGGNLSPAPHRRASRPDDR